jgi:2-haloacid dehalogenase
VAALDLRAFRVLTFDCYGTLCDWEEGLLIALRGVFASHDCRIGDEAILESFARHETGLEAGTYIQYRELLGRALEGMGEEFGFSPTKPETVAFGASVGNWPLFEDSTASLEELSRHFQLGVITNCDDDLFAATNARLGNRFEWIITAQRARSYKPNLNNFRLALEVIGVSPDEILHVAQSLHHDHVPAKQAGLKTTWIDRRNDKTGFGATPAASATPDLVVPDMKTFANLVRESLAGRAQEE